MSWIGPLGAGKAGVDAMMRMSRKRRDTASLALLVDHAASAAAAFRSRLERPMSCEVLAAAADGNCQNFVRCKLDEVAFVMEDIQEAVDGLLDSLDHVKGACFSGHEGVKPLLVDVMERPVRVPSPSSAVFRSALRGP